MLPNYSTTTLDSGLRLVLAPMEGVASVTVLAMVGVGSRYETEKQAGIAHFLEHMVFKGTANYPTAIDVSSAIDGVGGQYNAFTSKDYTGLLR
jgi:predicted Zn-dependent peptidase